MTKFTWQELHDAIVVRTACVTRATDNAMDVGHLACIVTFADASQRD
jgi:hypothetical protein